MNMRDERLLFIKPRTSPWVHVIGTAALAATCLWGWHSVAQAPAKPAVVKVSARG